MKPKFLLLLPALCLAVALAAQEAPPPETPASEPPAAEATPKAAAATDVPAILTGAPAPAVQPPAAAPDVKPGEGPAPRVRPGELVSPFTMPPFEVIRGASVSDLAADPPKDDVLRLRDRFKSGRDRVAVDIFRPAAPGEYPAVILLHGTHGPGRAERYYLQNAEDLARNGFVALFVRYYDRGRKGRGNRIQWTRTIQDALTFAATLPDVDPDCMGLLGFSQGAFLALNDAPSDERIRAVVAYYGGLSPGFIPVAQETMPPTLLFHGTSDRIVPVRRSLVTLESLRQEGRPADLVVYRGAGHGFCLNSRQGMDSFASEDSWQRTIAFLNFHLRYPGWSPAATPLPETADPPLPEGTAASPPPDGAPQAAFKQPPFKMLPYLQPPEGPREGEVVINPSLAEMQVLIKSSPPPRKRGKKRPAGKPAAKKPPGAAKAPAAKDPPAAAPKAAPQAPKPAPKTQPKK